ncbi:N-acetylneuraminate synthase family protein [Cecembia rubra]|uniref:N-acetylneuraminate synthase n=1 Tax=Cecembia rubra TaxID=1485585 RepID=A0A2P8E3A3_9BACT|nr:N-acetylneuraminate synthase family protein [Cecembia rubra]PSL03949.1 N-acetylneuraminate synthase [Cecembia rubra]
MKTLIIAEIAQAHEGSLGIAYSYIDALAACGVDAVKFQTHVAEAESSLAEPFRVKFSYVDQTRMDYWKRMEFTLEQWKGLKSHCDEVGVEFMSSPFSCAAVDILEEVGVKRYKIGSGEVSNFLLLEKIARTGKPIILSSGMSDYRELVETIDFLRPFGNELSILQCTTAYPTAPEQWGLQELAVLKEKFGLPVGYSDHSADITACIAASALGAEILEFHAVFDRRMFGPDAKASLEINEIKQLVASVRRLEQSFAADASKLDVSKYSELKTMFGKSLAVNKALKAGHVLRREDLESKKPSDQGIPAKFFQQVIGKVLNKNLNQWDFLREEDLK